MSLIQMKALVDEAHKNNMKVFVHIGSPENAIAAIQAGADILAHGVWRGKLSVEQADIIAQANIPMVYTIAGFVNVNHIHQGQFVPSVMDEHLVPANILGPVYGTKGIDVHKQEVMNAFFKNVHTHSPDWLSNFKLLNERGVPILIGTDSNLPGTYAGSTYLQELDILQTYGMSNYDLLNAATYRNAHLFLENPDFGSIEISKKADLLLLNGNPISNLNVLKEPSLIMKLGKIIERI